jgi:uncharacterized protein (DUF4415 family)
MRSASSLQDEAFAKKAASSCISRRDTIIDKNVIGFFKMFGDSYKSIINNILKEYLLNAIKKHHIKATSKPLAD